MGATTVIRPLSRSATEEVSVGSVTLDDVGDMAETKQALTEAVLWPLQHPETFARLGVEPAARCSALRAARVRQDIRGARAGQLRAAVGACGQGCRADGQMGGCFGEGGARTVPARPRLGAVAGLPRRDRRPRARGAGRVSTPASPTAWSLPLLTELDGIEPLRDVGGDRRDQPARSDRPRAAAAGPAGKAGVRRAARRRGAPRNPAHRRQIHSAQRRRRPRCGGRAS